MALQRVPHLPLSAIDLVYRDGTASAMDNAGESVGIVGYVCLQNGNASTKTISSAGGKIYYRTNAVTWADVDSRFRVGIQDVSATTGLEDGTFDVYAELIPGTDTITANAFMSAAMDTGSKTLTHGQLIAIVFETTVRDGSDVINIDRFTLTSITSSIPYGTVDTTTLAKAASMPFAFIVFDDDTVGWIMGIGVPDFNRSSVTFGSTSTPDEYVASFTPSFTCQIDGMGVDLSDIDTADAFELILYEDPYGTPVALVTLTPDQDQTSSLNSTYSNGCFAITPKTLVAGVTYGVAVRPTTANTVTFGYIDLTTGFDKIKRCSPFGDTLKVGSRTDNTGAFSVVQDYYAPGLYLRISYLDDGRGVAEAGYQMGVI